MAPLTLWTQYLIANACMAVAVMWIGAGFVYFVLHAAWGVEEAAED